MLAQAEPPRPQKGMRKGTHSCYECRKRKVRCIFPKDSITCENCSMRGKRCTEQRRELLQVARLDTRENLKDRVARLEAALQASASSKTNANDDVDQTSSRLNGLEVGHDQQGPEPRVIRTVSPSSSFLPDLTPASLSPNDASTSIDKSSSQHINPIATLFDNAIWKSHGSDLDQEHHSKASRAKGSSVVTRHMHTCRELLSDPIPPELIGMIMIATGSWWHTWRPLGPWMPASIGDTAISTLPDFVLWALDSDQPAIVGLAMLCIAVCLQQLDLRVHQFIIRQLPRSPGVYFQTYFEKVNRYIINDPDYASTEEGIQTIMLASKIYMNLGLLRKSWVLTHQAISYGQLLGFHRPERLSTNESEANRHRRNQSWLSLCSGDVYSSLLLGLPYAADGRTIPVTQSRLNATSLLQHNLILLSAEVIDRNQRGLSLSVSRTEEIQRGLEAAMKECDEAFWNPSATLATGRISRHEYLDQTATHCWLYHVMVMLHMPLMIHSVEDAQLEKHRTACLEASRNFLRVYHSMRSDTLSAFGLVHVIDYQAFVCSALLILGLLGYGSSVHQVTNQDKDRDLIGLTIGTLRQASFIVSSPIASQACQGLETLMFLDRHECPRITGASPSNSQAKVVVPYAGTITISPGDYYTKSQTGCKSPATHPPLAFSLSYGALEESSDLVSEAPGLVSNTESENEQGGGLETWDDAHPEVASIDFDWAHTIAPSFEDDWAWLNDISH